MTTVFMAVLSVAAIVLGLRYRFGPQPANADALLSQVRRPGSPIIVGNLVIAGGPAGASMLAMCVALIVGGSVMILLLVLALALGVVSAWFVWDPPTWSKARWLLEGEASGRWPVPTRTATDVVIVGFVVLCCSFALVFVMVSVIVPSLQRV